eukprot:Nk52_evm18s358 gene=Nk52_evmTU18s358
MVRREKRKKGIGASLIAVWYLHLCCCVFPAPCHGDSSTRNYTSTPASATSGGGAAASVESGHFPEKLSRVSLGQRVVVLDGGSYQQLLHQPDSVVVLHLCSRAKGEACGGGGPVSAALRAFSASVAQEKNRIRNKEHKEGEQEEEGEDAFLLKIPFMRQCMDVIRAQEAAQEREEARRRESFVEKRKDTSAGVDSHSESSATSATETPSTSDSSMVGKTEDTGSPSSSAAPLKRRSLFLRFAEIECGLYPHICNEYSTDNSLRGSSAPSKESPPVISVFLNGVQVVGFSSEELNKLANFFEKGFPAALEVKLRERFPSKEWNEEEKEILSIVPSLGPRTYGVLTEHQPTLVLFYDHKIPVGKIKHDEDLDKGNAPVGTEKGDSNSCTTCHFLNRAIEFVGKELISSKVYKAKTAMVDCAVHPSVCYPQEQSKFLDAEAPGTGALVQRKVIRYNPTLLLVYKSVPISVFYEDSSSFWDLTEDFSNLLDSELEVIEAFTDLVREVVKYVADVSRWSRHTLLMKMFQANSARREDGAFVQYVPEADKEEDVLKDSTYSVKENHYLIEISDDNFSDFITQSKDVYVVFYGRGCLLCKSLEKEYVLAARQLYQNSIEVAKDASSKTVTSPDSQAKGTVLSMANVNIARFNCDVNSKHKSICHAANIKEYPVIMVYPNKSSKKKKTFEYPGERNSEAILLFMYQQLVSNNDNTNMGDQMEENANAQTEASGAGGDERKCKQIATLNTARDFKEFSERDPDTYQLFAFTVPWSSKSKSLMKVLTAVNAVLDASGSKACIARVNCAELELLCQRYGAKSFPMLALLQNGVLRSRLDEKNTDMASIDAVTDFIRSANGGKIKSAFEFPATPTADSFVLKLTELNFFPTCNIYKRLVVLFYDSKTKKPSKKLRRLFEEASLMLSQVSIKSPFAFSKLDCYKFKSFCESAAIDVKATPYIRTYTKGGSSAEEYRGGKNVDDLISFAVGYDSEEAMTASLSELGENSNGDDFLIDKNDESVQKLLKEVMPDLKQVVETENKEAKKGQKKRSKFIYTGFPVEMTETNCEQTFEDIDGILVFFHTPWCTHCKALMPVFNLVAARLSGYARHLRGRRMALAHTDCSGAEAGMLGKICGRVKEFPTMKMFVFGTVLAEYAGKRTEDDIYNFVLGFVDSIPSPLDDLQERGLHDMAGDVVDEEYYLLEKRMSDPEAEFALDYNVIFERYLAERKLGASEDPVAVDELFKEQVLKESEVTMLLFEVEVCDKCKIALANMEKVARIMYAYTFENQVPHGEVAVGRFDCTGLHHLCERQAVSAYPSIVMYTQGRFMGIYGGDLFGENASEDILKYLTVSGLRIQRFDYEFYSNLANPQKNSKEVDASRLMAPPMADIEVGDMPEDEELLQEIMDQMEVVDVEDYLSSERGNEEPSMDVQQRQKERKLHWQKDTGDMYEGDIVDQKAVHSRDPTIILKSAKDKNARERKLHEEL